MGLQTADTGTPKTHLIIYLSVHREICMGVYGFSNEARLGISHGMLIGIVISILTGLSGILL